MATAVQSHVRIGSGLTGLVTTIKCQRLGKRASLVDRDRRGDIGWVALWCFGGMTCVGTPLQTRTNISGALACALHDCVGFGKFCRSDLLPVQRMRFDVKRSGPQAYDWLVDRSIDCLPAVNRRQRDYHGNGTSLPHHQVPWVTSLSRFLARSRSGRCEYSDVRYAEAVGLLSGARDEPEASRASE